ncbi:MAG: hypothetical protein CME64_04885 [Halobacteriovoraceae bacterium]|nr:hypothetical protein [Halobacteriovoraceae bacterium]|tara:strand:- start:360635 stop:361672 length:1038 start_codon:yes stop_codon:yes gene_type:complete
MKKTYKALLVLLFSSNALAFDLDGFCEQANAQRLKSIAASKSNGRYRQKVLGPGEDFSKYVSRNYRGCPHDIGWMSETFQEICNGENSKDSISPMQLRRITLPKLLVFAFAGAGDFNAEKAKNAIAPVNIRGYEGNDLTGHTMSLGFYYKVFGRRTSDIQLAYYSSSGFHQKENYTSALACMQQSVNHLNAIEYITGEEPEVKWVLMGYSNGGAHSIDLQEELAGMNKDVDLVFTVDPIVQTVFFPLHTLKSEIGERHPNTKMFVNYYQRDDFWSLPPLLLRGKPVPGADFNYNVTGHKDLHPKGYKNHNNIVKLNMIANRARCEISKLLNEECKTVKEKLEEIK